MKQRLFNALVYGLVAYSLLNAGYLALPPEIQASIPYSEITAIIGGGASGLLGLGGMTVQAFLTKAKKEADAKFNLLAQNYLNLDKKYDNVIVAYKRMENEQHKTTIAIERNNRLLEIDLRAKLSNPLIDDKVAELIRGEVDDK